MKIFLSNIRKFTSLCMSLQHTVQIRDVVETRLLETETRFSRTTSLE